MLGNRRETERVDEVPGFLSSQASRLHSLRWLPMRTMHGFFNVCSMYVGRGGRYQAGRIDVQKCVQTVWPDVDACERWLFLLHACASLCSLHVTSMLAVVV
jgi:hypothetical protein